MKYLLTNGTSTNKIEYYIIDLYKLYLILYPKDVPGAFDVGSNFILSSIKKDNVVSKVTDKINQLTEKIKQKVGTDYEIITESINFLDEQKVKIVLNVNKITQEITIDV